jgi:enamine deaminase RidA (YjgF/YER057c/UK114 family)
MKRKLISSGSTFEKETAYSRAVVVGDWIFVSGTTGFDYDKMTISEDIVEQTEMCFKNIEKAMVQAGSSLKDIVRVTYILPDAANFQKCQPVIRKYLENVRPAATMISADLVDKRMKIEIEVTGIKH